MMMPDGNVPEPQPQPPTRQQIELNQRNTIAVQLLDGEVDKAMLINEVTALRRENAELKKLLAPVEPADARAPSL